MQLSRGMEDMGLTALMKDRSAADRSYVGGAALGGRVSLGLGFIRSVGDILVENIPVVNISPRMEPRTGGGVCQRED